jgi:hypothetical protein
MLFDKFSSPDGSLPMSHVFGSTEEEAPFEMKPYSVGSISLQQSSAEGTDT